MANTDALTVMQGYKPGLDAHDHPVNRQFMVEVFGWMTAGLALTGAVAASVAFDPLLARAIIGNSPLFYTLLGVQLVLVFVLAGWAESMSFTGAAAVFMLYAALNGVTMSVIFLAYTTASIASVFFVTAGTFGVMSAYGFATKADLTSLGNLCFMGLVGIVIASLVNLYFKNPAVLWATTYIGVLVFVGLTAYDTQKIKQLGLLLTPGSEEEEKESIVGALTLYLDFINLFLDILRIMGRRKN